MSVRLDGTKLLVVEAVVLSFDDARYQAMIDCRIDRLDSLLADDLVYTHSDGRTETKPQYLAALRSGQVKYLKADRSVRHLHVRSATAWMQGDLRTDVVVDGRPFCSRVVFTAVWQQTEDGWSMAAWAATRATERP